MSESAVNNLKASQEEGSRPNRLGLTGTILKLIAISTMLIDHIAAALLVGTEHYLELREIGRISFPIFCFLMAEGMFHTRDICKYALRLGIFALISEIPYDLAFYGTPFYWQQQNVFITLFLAVTLVAVSRELKFRERGIIVFSVGFACLVLADISFADYGAIGVIIILLFYYLRKKGIICYLIVAAFMLFCWWGQIQMYAILALPLLLLYNGKKGSGIPKYAFYGFYPVHLLILWIIRVVM